MSWLMRFSLVALALAFLTKPAPLSAGGNQAMCELTCSGALALCMFGGGDAELCAAAFEGCVFGCSLNPE